MQASRAFDLPCPWAPLQSMTAAASRESPGDGATGGFAGQRHRAIRFALLRPSGFGARVDSPKRVGSCSVSRRLPPTGEPPKRNAGARHAAWELDDNSLGVRILSAFAAWAIVAPVCLTDTVRSQGFSPSQRFDPARASWLCFAPHPPLGFLWPSELFPLGQP
jgi:hypothetical protein